MEPDSSGLSITASARLTNYAEPHTDGGGKKLAVPKPLVEAEKIARFFAGIAKKDGGRVVQATVTRFNGLPGILAIEPDQLPRTTSLEIRDGKIAAIYIVRNPDKLAHLRRLVGYWGLS